MKKLISLLLAISICSGICVNFAYAENYNISEIDIVSENVQTTEDVLLEDEYSDKDETLLTTEDFEGSVEEIVQTIASESDNKEILTEKNSNENKQWELDGYIPEIINEGIAVSIDNNIYILERNSPEKIYKYDTLSKECTASSICKL